MSLLTCAYCVESKRVKEYVQFRWYLLFKDTCARCHKAFAGPSFLVWWNKRISASLHIIATYMELNSNGIIQMCVVTRRYHINDNFALNPAHILTSGCRWLLALNAQLMKRTRWLLNETLQYWYTASLSMFTHICPCWPCSSSMGHCRAPRQSNSTPWIW